MTYTDDAIWDAARHMSQQEREEKEWLESRPLCGDCAKPITTYELYEFGDVVICPKCLQRKHKKWTEDYCD